MSRYRGWLFIASTFILLFIAGVRSERGEVGRMLIDMVVGGYMFLFGLDALRGDRAAGEEGEWTRSS